MTSCASGCVVFRHHLKTCPVPDRSAGAWVSAGLDEQQRDQLMDGDLALVDDRPRGHVWIGRYGGLETWKDCRGCLPRDADYGTICGTCHADLVSWLHQVCWLNGWLTANIPPGNEVRLKQNWQMSGTPDGEPTPLRVAILDVRDLLVDRVTELEDCARDVFDRPMRPGAPWSTASTSPAAAFLFAWLTKIEEDGDLVCHMIDLLADVFRRAQSLVPWDSRPRRLSGIICPHCERTTLEVRPGMEDVSCRTCNAVISRGRYEIWTRMLVEEAKVSA